MTGWLGSAYLYIKALHIIFVIFWMAGLFMLPRFFAYHLEEGLASVQHTRWQTREKALLRIILTPSMLLSWLFGVLLLVHIGFDSGMWLSLKLFLVLLLTGFQGFLTRCHKDLAEQKSKFTAKTFRLLNEIPGVMILLIVPLVLLKPF
jgi:protoporphyrinogen IX oxidase